MWQDWYFATVGLVYSAVLIPSMLNPKTEIPRRSSVTTAVAVSCSALAYATLGFWLASASCVYGALTWGFLAWRRPIRPVAHRLGMVLTDDREMAVVEEYRKWQLHQQLIYEAHGIKEAGGGCGGCPSQGACDEEG